MSLMLFNKEKLILRISSGGFAGLYDKILEIMEEKSIELNELKKLIDNLYLGTGGFGLDFSNYLKRKKDAILFADLVKEGIEKFIQESPTLTEESKKRLWNFHKELINYAEELKE